MTPTQADVQVQRQVVAGFPTLTYLRTEVRRYGTDESPYFRAMDIVRMANPAEHSFEYTGQGKDWPLFDRMVWEEGCLHRLGTMPVCGNGWEDQVIGPGESVLLVVHSTRTLDLYADTRDGSPGCESCVGLSLVDQSTGERCVVWSNLYTPTLERPR